MLIVRAVLLGGLFLLGTIGALNWIDLRGRLETCGSALEQTSDQFKAAMAEALITDLAIQAKDRRILQLEADLDRAQRQVRIEWRERSLGPVPIFGR